jgi:membrane fusion protein (multidrug efflux system)
VLLEQEAMDRGERHSLPGLRSSPIVSHDAIEEGRSFAEAEPDSIHAPEPATADAAKLVHGLEGQSSDVKDGGEASQGGSVRRRLLLGGGLLALAIASAGYLYWDHAGRFESTDDAFIAARQFAMEPKVSGYVGAVLVTDNEHVAAGDVIARIDDRDYRIALDQAQAQVENAEANVQNTDALIAVQEATIAASEAQLKQAQAALVFAQQQAERYQQLAQNGAGSIQNAQQYASQLQQQQAAVATAQAMFKQPTRQLQALKAQRIAAEASLGQAKAQRSQAELNLEYTTIKAPQAGRVVNLGASVGLYAQQGASLATFVPDEIWVTANFKETQLDAMQPGQAVTLRLDAYPERGITGHLASIQPGSGTAFSLLPAENATGNYVKIVQRVPVKIAIDNPPANVALGPGMSVSPTVRIDSRPSLYERLRGWL